MKSPRPDSPPPFATLSRRRFLQRCAAIAAMTGLPLWFVQRQELEAEEAAPAPGPLDRPGVALIGCGGMGRHDADLASKYGDIVAVCDVDATHAAQARKQFTSGGRVPAVYADFRRVFEDPNVHVVVNATPDHWHTLVNIAAARSKRDVYGEKPLTLTVDEGRHLVGVVRENGTILQTGTQQRSMAQFRLACELVRNRRIGTLRRANVWLPAGLRDGPFHPEPVPQGLDWDFWQGQAPATAYVKQRCHGTFRFWYEYSGGTMTDWGAHHNDIAYWAIGILAPRDVESRVLSQPIPGGYTTFAEYAVTYTYANGVELNIHTTTDETIYGAAKDPKHPGQRNGIRFEGSDGWIWVNRDGISASDPALLTTPLPEGAVRLYHSDNHMGNFFDCVRTRRAPICDAETGHRSATMCHLGAISMRTGLKLRWDAQNQRFIGWHAHRANAYLAREMRPPYDYSMVGG